MPVTPRRLLLLIAPVVALMALAAVIGHAALFVVYPLVMVPLAVFVLTNNARLSAASPRAAKAPSARAAPPALPAAPRPWASRRALIILAGGLVAFYALVRVGLPGVAALVLLWLPVVAHRTGVLPGSTAYSLLGADRLSVRERRAVRVVGYVFVALVAADVVLRALTRWT